ncbi:hypothetical protein C8R45DRAFT_1056803 [Mycena sanguinolenta]|nr:hypothetical protein C8R45DRAFT_1056803 [Mycena sanguinolenta]
MSARLVPILLHSHCPTPREQARVWALQIALYFLRVLMRGYRCLAVDARPLTKALAVDMTSWPTAGIHDLTGLWTVPGRTLTLDAPVRWPGISSASTAAVRDYLQKDYEQHHGFFNDGGFHNHTPFHLLVKWVLGATPSHLTAIWNQHVSIERPAFRSPRAITEETFADHLGDENFYQAYLHFFSDLVLRKLAYAVLEEWIFSPSVNYAYGGRNKDGQRVEMLNRLLAGIMHPLIYVGYALEFSLPGLAQAAVHKVVLSTLVPRYLFDSIPRSTTGAHAFSILARILRKPHFDNVVPNFKFKDIHTKYGDDIQRYAREWIVEAINAKEVVEKVKELVLLNVMLYSMGGWRDREGFHRAEFTLMHLVTSSVTLTSYMATISSPRSKSLLLRTYFSRSLAYYISRGRPAINVRSFFKSSIGPTIPGPTPKPYTSAFPAPASVDALTPNAWLQIIQSALVHPDYHLCKIQRTLAHYGSVYSDIAAGEFKGTELDGSEMVDRTLFFRAAGLTMEKMGQVREGEKDKYWTNNPNYLSSFDI